MEYVIGLWLLIQILEEPLNKSPRTPAGSFSDCRCQSPLDVAMLRLRVLFLAIRKNPSAGSRLDLFSDSLKENIKEHPRKRFL